MNPDRLVLLALGEAVTDPAEANHVDGCATCQLDLDAMCTVAHLGRQAQDLTDLPAPSERVWHRIVKATGVDDGSVSSVVSTAAVPRKTRVPDPAPVTDYSLVATGALIAPRRFGTDRRWRHWGRSLTVATAAAVVAVIGTLGVVQVFDQPPAAPGNQVTATAQLDALPIAAGSRGVARVLDDDLGDRLHVHVTGLPVSDGFYEVWLIDPDSTRMVSIGLLRDDGDALLPLPSTVDLGRYRLVDVSAEDYDGDAAHSGRSLLRGTLTG